MPVSIPDGQDMLTPLAGFNFHVTFKTGNPAFADVPDEIAGGFSEVSGIEATMEPRLIKVGGRNYGAIQRPGPVSFSTVVLKRGIVSEWRHLWAWWSLISGATGGEGTNGGWSQASRTDVTIAILFQRQAMVAWTLINAMPIKFRVGDLNARTAEVAIEELHLTHEGLRMEPVA